MAIEMNVNMDSIVAFANKLERLNKTALPNAVRTTLNSAAFDVKKNTLLKTTRRTFTQRQKNFFKANSRVEMASIQKNIDNMQSTVGMRDLSGSNHAVKNLEQQETGGTIGGKALTPLDPARSGKNYRKKVAPRNRIRGKKTAVNTKYLSGKTNKQKFIVAINKAGAGGLVIHNGIMWRVNSTARKRNGSFRITAIYDVEKGRKIKVKGTHFMQIASEKSATKLDEYFYKAAQTQFNRVLK